MELTLSQLTLAKIVQLGRYDTVKTRSEYYSLQVTGSIPVRCNFFIEFILLQYNSGRTAIMTYFSGTSIEVSGKTLEMGKKNFELCKQIQRQKKVESYDEAT